MFVMECMCIGYMNSCYRAGGMSTEVVTGLNIQKNGSDPALKKDDELPEWLWKLGEQPKTLAELERSDANDLSLEEQRMLQKLKNRRKIKQKNALRAK